MTSSAKQRHAHMVEDQRRTPALLKAVAACVRPGDTVLDIGTGLGVLAIAAARAGAGRVYALEVDAHALREARANARRAGIAESIEFRQELSFSAKLPERCDVILCETVGSFGFDENILATLRDARRRFLKRGGRIVPQKLELFGAPIERMPKLDLPAEIGRVRPSWLLGPAVKIADVDFSGRIPEGIHARCELPVRRSGTAVGVALWPRATWWKGSVSDASPMKPATHWKQGILELEPRQAKAGQKLQWELIIGPHPEEPRLMTERLWRWRD